MDDENLDEIPDFILSDTLEKDLTISINVCALALRDSTYLSDGARIGGCFGAIPEGQREGANLLDWRDFQIPSVKGEPLYTAETFSDFDEHEALASALWMIVKDICDDGRMLSEDWYCARMLYEYFREYPSGLLAGFRPLGFPPDICAYPAGLARSGADRVPTGSGSTWTSNTACATGSRRPACH